MAELRVDGITELKSVLEDSAKLQSVRKAVQKNAAQLQSKAMHKAPVKTGFLRRSIALSIQDSGLTAICEPTAAYAPYQEFGTRFMPAHPFIRPALWEQEPTFISDIKKATGG